MAPTGLYVHVPFCSVKCFYCDFAAFSGQGARRERYLAALEREFEGASALRGPFTLYVGGGTPTELSAEQLSRLLASVASAFGPVEGMAEATVEANPESLDRPRLEALRRGGVGRLSLGLQAVQDRLLKALGRQHLFAGFLDAYRAAREAGFRNLGVDLMFGLPGQSLADFDESLRTAAALGPEHVSVYGLQVEDRTHFKKRGVREPEDLSREMMELAAERLVGAGYEHYEVSNFARPGFRAAHNTLYWTGAEYRGFGCGAASYAGGRRWSNLDRLEDYLAAVEAGRSPEAGSERLEGKERLGEAAWLGLRLLDGLPLTDELRTAFAEDWEALGAEGLVELEDGRARLSREGLFVANKVFQRFVPPFGP